MTGNSVGVAVGVLGLLMSGLSLTLTSYRARVADVVAIAQRLTALEKAGDSMPKGLSERLASIEQRISAPERLAERLATLEQKAAGPERIAERLGSIEQAVRSLPDANMLVSRLIQVETKIDLFWRGLSVDAARVLHSPHPEWARRDALLEAFMSHRMTAEEAGELGAMLLEVFHDHDGDAGQRMAAAVVLKFLHTEHNVKVE